MQKYPLLGKRQLTYSSYIKTSMRLDGLFASFLWILFGIILVKKLKISDTRN